jgi:thiol-disulfide isomerase/thioredoxin
MGCKDKNHDDRSAYFSWQIVLGFILSNVFTLLNFEGMQHITFGVFAGGMALIGFLLGAREKSPITMVICYHAAVFIGSGLITLLDNPGLFPNTFPLLFITSGLSMYIAILSRQLRLSAKIGASLIASLLVFSSCMALYALPVHYYQVNESEIQIPAAGISLIGLNTSDVKFPIEGKKVVVLDFWNTKCASCFQSKHELIALADQWRNDSRVLVASVASAKYDSLDGVKASDYLTLPGSGSMPEFYDPGGRLAEMIAPHGCPVVGFVDGAGMIRSRHSGYERSTRSVYRRLLSQKIKEMLASS